MGTPTGLHPQKRTLTTQFVARGAAVDGSTVIGKAPFTGTLNAASILAVANIVGANVDTRTFTIVNKGQDGNGATVMATLAMTNGVNADDFDEKAFIPSVVAGATDCAKGDVLAFVSTHAGNGIADPGGMVVVELKKD